MKALLLVGLLGCSASPAPQAVTVEPVPVRDVDASIIPVRLTPSQTFERVQPVPMPAGETWSGVYFHPVFGYLHVVEQAGHVMGRWKRADSSHWGELSGTTTGNVLRFTWKEHAYGPMSPSETTSGAGVFVYASEGLGRLEGQYAESGAQEVSSWTCIKQRNVKPDLKSVTDEVNGIGGSWD